MACASQRGCDAARAHVHTALLYLMNGWADDVEIWYADRDHLVRWLANKNIWECKLARAHVHTSLIYLS